MARSPELSLDYIIARPQMARYIACSTKIYNIYLKYIAPEDIHVYSIDEVFIDVNPYLRTYDLSARELAMLIILDVLDSSGITATAGIGTNLFLSKVAMDIEAKHVPADKNGVRIAELDEMTFRRSLVTEVFYILPRCNQQERARVGNCKSGKLSKAAKIEYAKRMESAGLEWER